MNYWLDLFTGTTWKQFRDAGATTSGFRERMRGNVAKVEPGDLFLCYLNGVMRWIGALRSLDLYSASLSSSRPANSRQRSIAFWAFFSLLIAIALIGCKSVSPVDPSVKAIQINEPHKVVAGVNAIVLPPGIYRPDFTTKHGVYYRAPSPLTTSGVGLDTAERGGLYLPNSSDSDHRQGVWIDRYERSTSFAVQSPKQVLRFEEHIPFEAVSQSTSGVAK